MALTKSFYEAVETGNVRRIRIMMKDSLLVDPTFKELNEMESAAAGVSGLYDEHDGESFVLDKAEWNDDYMNKQKVQLIYNFSHERLNHLKDVVRVLRPVKYTAKEDSNTTGTHTSGASRSYEEQKRFDQQSGTYKGAVIAGGAVAGAVVGGVIVAAAGGAVAVGAVAGAVVGGAAASAVVVLGGKK